MRGDEATHKKEWLFDYLYSVKLGKKRLFLIRTDSIHYSVFDGTPLDHKTYAKVVDGLREKRQREHIDFKTAGYYWRCYDQGTGIGPSAKRSNRHEDQGVVSPPIES